ncbi:hypothetical protein [Lactiplantibacillus plantarum]|uniref:hypothetical protein n=1 Tax=Lactiplantibacillus plantarum TaxID=1590 RepID=UPI0026474E39|nr:hypothetical protein [Lactiplantibacillus plantarum]WGS69641.1 hypothetical protein NQL29_04505 [Lactiplantibacillus plantarum]
MNTRILNALKQTTLIEEKQKASHCFVEDMPPYAINQELSLKEHGRVLRNYFFKKLIPIYSLVAHIGRAKTYQPPSL